MINLDSVSRLHSVIQSIVEWLTMRIAKRDFRLAAYSSHFAPMLNLASRTEQ